MRVASISFRGLLLIIFVFTDSETAESSISNSLSTPIKEKKIKAQLFPTFLNAADPTSKATGLEKKGEKGGNRGTLSPNTFRDFEAIMLEEFNKMESSYHETMQRDKKEQGEEIGRLRGKHTYDDDSQLNRLENDLHQEISLLKTSFRRNRDNIIELKESAFEESRTEVAYPRSNNQRPNSNRVKRQPTPTIAEQIMSTKPQVDFCTKPRYCTLKHKSHKSLEEDKKKNDIENVDPPTSCEDLVRMGYTLDGFYPLLGKEENAERVSINHCSFNLTHDTLKAEGNNVKVACDEFKGFINSNCCYSATQTNNSNQEDKPVELNDQNNEDQLEDEKTTPKAKVKKSPKTTTVLPDTFQQQPVMAIGPDTVQAIGNVVQNIMASFFPMRGYQMPAGNSQMGNTYPKWGYQIPANNSQMPSYYPMGG